MQLDIPKGAVFGAENPMMLGKAINALQWIWAKDGESTYSHSGIFQDGNGTTLESLWTVKSQNFFEVYKGKQVIIAVPKCREESIASALERIKQEHEGQVYPFWRLVLHIIPPFAKIAWFDRLVCSELTAKYEYYAGVRHRMYKGTNPDTLADEWRRWTDFTVLFEGIL